MCFFEFFYNLFKIKFCMHELNEAVTQSCYPFFADARITLVTVGCWDGNVYIFDICKCPKIMYDGGVMRLLQSAEVLKVRILKCDFDLKHACLFTPNCRLDIVERSIVRPSVFPNVTDGLYSF